MAAVIRTRTQPWIVVGLVLAVLYAVVFAILGSTAFGRAPELLALAVTFDLTVTSTVAVWWFGVRRRALPAWTALAVLSCGVAIARRWVPHAPLSALLAIGAALEVLTMSWLVLRIRRVIRSARAARGEGPIGAIEAGLVAAQVPARVAAILASELAVVGLALTGWFRRPAPRALSMRSTGWMSIAGVIGFLIGVESAATHLLIAMWSPLAAWLATASSAYALLWLVGDAQAIRLYPVAVVGDRLRVTVGVRWRVSIPLADIAALDEIRRVPEGALDLALLEPTVLLTLRAPAEVRGLLWKRRRGDRIALTIDDPSSLIAAIGAVGAVGAVGGARGD